MNVCKTVAALVLLGVAGTAWEAWAKSPEKPAMPDSVPPAWDKAALEEALNKPRYTLSTRFSDPSAAVVVPETATVDLVPQVGVSIRADVRCVAVHLDALVPTNCQPGVEVPLALQVIHSQSKAVLGTIQLKAKVSPGTNGGTIDHALSAEEVSKFAAGANLDRQRLSESRLALESPTISGGEVLGSAADAAKRGAAAAGNGTVEQVEDGWIVRGLLGSQGLSIFRPGTEVCGQYVTFSTRGVWYERELAAYLQKSILGTGFKAWSSAEPKGLKSWREYYKRSIEYRYARWPKQAPVADNASADGFTMRSAMLASDALTDAYLQHIFSWNTLGRAKAPWGSDALPEHESAEAVVLEFEELKEEWSRERPWRPQYERSHMEDFRARIRAATPLTSAGAANAALPTSATCARGNMTVTIDPKATLPLTLKAPPVEIHYIDWPEGTLVGEVTTTTVATSDVPVMTLFE